ncbi:hypothetical protein [Streptomyces sp. NPDC051776]|uniref:hypothetical protein n=1 Tax=Streptomyces sp. NPDC051776 TaxID=3155414 RepID=UPI00343B4529
MDDGPVSLVGHGGSTGAERPAEQLPDRSAPAEGCLTVAIRMPVRIFALVVVVPVRLVWDALAACGKALERTVLRRLARGLGWLGRTLILVPFGAVGRALARVWTTLIVLPCGAVGRALAWAGRTLVAAPLAWFWHRLMVPAGRGLGAGLARLARALFVLPWVALHRYVLAPVGRAIGTALVWLGRHLVAIPASALYAHVLTPLGHALVRLGRTLRSGAAAVVCGAGIALAALGRYAIVVPAVALHRYVLTPLGHALVWLGRTLIVVPLVAVRRWVLRPLGHGIAIVGREIGESLRHAWRVAAYISRAVWRFLATLFRWIFVRIFAELARRVYRAVLTPVGHVVRDQLWRPARRAVREARRSVRQAVAAAWLTVRQTRAEAGRLLFGKPRREPLGAGARTLGSSKTAPTKD